MTRHFDKYYAKMPDLYTEVPDLYTKFPYFMPISFFMASTVPVTNVGGSP